MAKEKMNDSSQRVDKQPIRTEDVDPVTFSIVRHRLWMLVDEMAITLKQTTTSEIVAEALDFQTALLAADGAVLVTGSYSQIMTMPMHFGVKYILENLSENPGIKDGDHFIFNDPYLGQSTHQGDTSIVRPIFHDGEIVAWAGTCCHEQDIGATLTPGVKITEVYQEGLRMSPIKLVEAGHVRKDVFDALINMIRIPAVALDYQAQIAANNVAAERLCDLIDSYSLKTVQASVNRLMSNSKEMLQELLKRLPRGVASHLHRIDHDGHENRVYELHCSLTNSGDRLKIDLTGTSIQAPGNLNSGYGGTWGGVLGGTLLWLGEANIPWNQGIFDRLELVLPEGSIVNAKPPAPMSGGSCQGCYATIQSIGLCLSRFMAATEEFMDWAMAGWMGAISAMGPFGINQYGENYFTRLLDHNHGGGGATCDMDGDDVVGCLGGTSQMINIESYEEKTPILFLFRRITPDTGGPGKYRGGMALEEALIPHQAPEGEEVNLSFIGSGAEQPNSTGLFGGYPGCINLYKVVRDSDAREQLERKVIPTQLDEIHGRVERMPPKGLDVLWRNDTIHYYVQGGGGWGDPLDRKPDSVALDFRNAMVTRQHARDAYGVVLDGESGDVDIAGTEKLRAQMREERLQC